MDNSTPAAVTLGTTLPVAFADRAFLSLPEFARIVGLCRTSLEVAWREKRLATILIGKRRLVPVCEIARFTAAAMASLEGGQ